MTINRIIGSRNLDHIDPYVLLDEIASSDPGDDIAMISIFSQVPVGALDDYKMKHG